MILIDNVEILTVQEPITWTGAKDQVARTLEFSFLYNPLKADIERYSVNIGSRVEWIEDGRTLFLGDVMDLSYTTDEDTISVSCQDLASRLIRSKYVGRMRGTLTELANNICGSFGIKNGIESDSTHIHNIVSDGDLSYFEILKTACDTMFERYTLYMDADTLKLAEHNVVNTFEIGKNIRSSNFSQTMGELVTRVLIIDNDGNLLNAVEDTENLEQFGLFQEVYNYNKDVKNNLAEAKKLLKGVQSEGGITVDNDNNCISGRFIKIIEPVNGFEGIFEIQTDNHIVQQDSVLTMEVKNVPVG